MPGTITIYSAHKSIFILTTSVKQKETLFEFTKKMGKCKYCIINKLHQNLCTKKVRIDVTCKKMSEGAVTKSNLWKKWFHYNDYNYIVKLN